MITTVGSFQEAEKYPVAFGTTDWFLDETKDVFYIKSVDQLGKYSMSTYKFEQIDNPKPLSAEDFVTRKQFDDMSAKLDMLIQQLSKRGE